MIFRLFLRGKWCVLDLSKKTLREELNPHRTRYLDEDGLEYFSEQIRRIYGWKSLTNGF